MIITLIILLTIAFGLLTVFTFYVTHLFGTPESYPNTFYMLNEKQKYIGWIYPIVFESISLLLQFAWLKISIAVLPAFTFLSFIACAGLSLVAIAPFFKEANRYTGKPLSDFIYYSFHGRGLVQTLGTLIAMICAIIWSILATIWIPFLAMFVLAFIIMLVTRTWRSALFWFEFATFYGILIMLRLETVIIMFFE